MTEDNNPDRSNKEVTSWESLRNDVRFIFNNGDDSCKDLYKSSDLTVRCSRNLFVTFVKSLLKIPSASLPLRDLKYKFVYNLLITKSQSDVYTTMEEIQTLDKDMARLNPCIWTAKSYYKGTNTNDLDDFIIKKCFQNFNTPCTEQNIKDVVLTGY